MSKAEVELLAEKAKCSGDDSAPPTTGRSLLALRRNGASCSIVRVRALQAQIAFQKIGKTKVSLSKRGKFELFLKTIRNVHFRPRVQLRARESNFKRNKQGRRESKSRRKKRPRREPIRRASPSPDISLKDTVEDSIRKGKIKNKIWISSFF